MSSHLFLQPNLTVCSVDADAGSPITTPAAAAAAAAANAATAAAAAPGPAAAGGSAEGAGPAEDPIAAMMTRVQRQPSVRAV
jgi:hypothetical protein